MSGESRSLTERLRAEADCLDADIRAGELGPGFLITIKLFREAADQIVADAERIKNALEALDHLHVCGSCADDSWSCCEGGRHAEITREQLREVVTHGS